jgi:hypothetical protein
MTHATHLDPQTLAALAAGATAGPDAAEHLTGCSACLAELSRLTGALARLEALAAYHAPHPTRPLRRLTACSPAAPRLRPALIGLAASAATVAVAAGLLLTLGRGPASTLESGLETAFMEEVRALAEDPLPAFYQELVPDTGASLDAAPSPQTSTPDATSGALSKGRMA